MYCSSKRRRPRCENCHEPDWTFMEGLFQWGIMPTDIDGMVEQDGNFLFIESKREGEQLSHGQELALKRLAQQPNTTVLVVWGPCKENGTYNVKHMASQNWLIQIPEAALAAVLRAWSVAIPR